MTKLLVASGFEGKLKVEVVNLDQNKPNLICGDLPSISGVYRIGQLFNGNKPIACNCSACEIFQGGQWQSISRPTYCEHERLYSSAILTNSQGREILLIAEENLNIGSNFGIYDGFGWKYRPINKQVRFYCIVKINSSTILFIGGANHFKNDPINNTYFYNVQTNTWTTGPPLKIPRKYLSCGILIWNNPETNNMEKIVVAAGGYGKEQSLSSVELLSLNDDGESNGEWFFGPALPDKNAGATMVEYKNTVILIGGGNEYYPAYDSLYQLSSPKSSWVQMEQNLREKRRGHISFLVPDDIVNCV